MSAQIEGLNGLLAALRKTELDVAESKVIHKEAAQVVAEEARFGVAVRSGKLRRSVRASATKKAGVVRAGSAKVPYALPYHFGHANRPQGGFMRPDPFMYDALDDRGPQVVRAYELFVAKTLARNF